MSTQKPQVAIYCRVATANDFAMETQRQSLLQFARERGFEEPLEYLDNGQKGATFHRPAFEQLNDAILQGQIQTVLIKDPERIHRDTFRFSGWLKEMGALGVTVISQNEYVHDEDSLFAKFMSSEPFELLYPAVEDNDEDCDCCGE